MALSKGSCVCSGCAYYYDVVTRSMMGDGDYGTMSRMRRLGVEAGRNGTEARPSKEPEHKRSPSVMD